eukprot:jgi/Tetstr1/427707/TSEL_017832.t1
MSNTAAPLMGVPRFQRALRDGGHPAERGPQAAPRSVRQHGSAWGLLNVQRAPGSNALAHMSAPLAQRRAGCAAEIMRQGI